MKNLGKIIYIPYGKDSLTFSLRQANLLSIASPKDVLPAADPLQELRRALQDPIDAPTLRQAVQGNKEVVILADDLTRKTPVDAMIPLLLDEFNAAGIHDDQVTVLIALGTHRPMTEAEILARFGEQTTRRVQVVNNPWQDPAQLVDLGETSNGTPVWVSRLAVEAGFLLGLGTIVPHHILGYSAGAKIVQPGVSGPGTTGATHYLSTRTRRSYLGMTDNPVRDEVEAIGDRVGLKAILNVALDQHGRLVEAFYGDPRSAHRAGVQTAKDIYGTPIRGQADIVIASSYPNDIEFWQAHKSLYAADIAVKPGGTIILATPCPEGVSATHQDMLAFTAWDVGAIQGAIENGDIADQVSGALALAWAKIRQRAQISLVSDGISIQQARALAFMPFESLDDALAAAFRVHGPDATVNVLTHAAETLPYIDLKTPDAP